MSSSDARERKTYERTTGGLVDALFEELEDLKAGVSSPHEAIAFSKLATNVTTAMGLELRRELSKLPPVSAPKRIGST